MAVCGGDETCASWEPKKHQGDLSHPALRAELYVDTPQVVSCLHGGQRCVLAWVVACSVVAGEVSTTLGCRQIGGRDDAVDLVKKRFMTLLFRKRSTVHQDASCQGSWRSQRPCLHGHRTRQAQAQRNQCVHGVRRRLFHSF